MDKDDVFNGGNQTDTLLGRADNDILNGRYGADTYIFAKGHGQDIINDYASSQDKDMLKLTDITLAETKFHKSNNDLILFGYHESNSITVKNFFNNSYYEIEQFAFKNQVVLQPDFAKYLNTANGMAQVMAVFDAKAMDNGAAEVLSVVVNPNSLLSSSAL